MSILPISKLVYESYVKAQPGRTGGIIAVSLSMGFSIGY